MKLLSLTHLSQPSPTPTGASKYRVSTLGCLVGAAILTGCCYVRTPEATVIDIGTGRRCVHVGKVVVTHSEIDDTLRATGALVGEAAKAAGYGGPNQ